MTDNKKQDPAIPFPRLQEYLRRSLHIHPEAEKLATVIRSLIKWILDFVRNLMVVGVLVFLANKTGSNVLYGISYLTMALLTAYLWTYLDTILLKPFHFINNQKTAAVANAAVSLVFVVALSEISLFGLNLIIAEIAAAYLRP